MSCTVYLAEWPQIWEMENEDIECLLEAYGKALMTEPFDPAWSGPQKEIQRRMTVYTNVLAYRERIRPCG